MPPAGDTERKKGGIMRTLLVGVLFIFSGTAATAVALENAVEYRVKCLINSVAKADTEAAMARGLRLFAESNGIPAAPNSILVRLIPDRAHNNTVQELRQSDLAAQWSVGANGELVFNERVNNHCTLKYDVIVRTRVNGEKVGGKLPNKVELAGSYVRVLTPSQRVRIKQRGRPRA